MARFRLGDHEFYDPREAAPLDRLSQTSRKPIAGAAPPLFLTPFAVPAQADGPAALLLGGEFCGHGEPTFTVFDLAVDGQREVNLALPFDDVDEPTALVRGAGQHGPWRKLFALHELFPDCCSHDGTGRPPQPITDDAGSPSVLRVAIGCEYPCDATSVDLISWVALAVEFVTDREHAVVFSRETA